MQVELIKMGGYDLHKCLHELIKQVCQEETLPEGWRRAFYAQYTTKEIL
jgi:hypothetical protein